MPSCEQPSSFVSAFVQLAVRLVVALGDGHGIRGEALRGGLGLRRLARHVRRAGAAAFHFAASHFDATIADS